jgi:DNA-directed RNA polymerase specialized sigma24 family protein
MSSRSPSADEVVKLTASIRYVLDKNGISDDEMPDLVQQVLLEAERSPHTPAAEPDRTRYINAIARNAAKALHIRRAKDPAIEPLADDDDAPQASDPAPDHGARDLAHKLIDEAEAADPKGLDWLVRAKIDGEPVSTIADSAGVSQELVRQRVARLRRRMQSVAAAMGVTASVVLLLMAMRAWRLRDRVSPIGPDIASTRPRAPTPQEKALALRRDALHELDLGDASACVRHLDEAKALDPAGDGAPEIVRARAQAQEMLNPPQELDWKQNFDQK